MRDPVLPFLLFITCFMGLLSPCLFEERGLLTNSFPTITTLPECWVVFKASASRQVVEFLIYHSHSVDANAATGDTHSPTPSNELVLYFPFSCAVEVFSTRDMFDLISLPFLFIATRFLNRCHTIMRKREVFSTVIFCVNNFQEMRLTFPQIRCSDLLTEAERCCFFSFLLICTQNLSFQSSFSLCAMFSERKVNCHKVKWSINKTFIYIVNVVLKIHCCC